ncbi:hypothetical protein COY07_01955 [Candidatus Peregrinibacteria bacterium CG_4_10_14_0_2_um_filter_43_11]|nr:MAG: hypothetical protein COY07_01955 [Candidatus Peregrinibacteria bacterium CG_4_10_14_0_2_um_filter_43_11]
MQNLLLFLFGLILLSPVSGELWRLSVFWFALLPSDLLIPIFFVVWVIYKLKHDRVIRFGKIGKTILLFLFVMFIGYFINVFRFDGREMIMAASYFARFVLYIVMAFITFDLLKNDRKKYFLMVAVGAMMFSFFFISVLGFLQLHYFPSFLDLGMDAQGWDPHIGRLLSTWFDPNFVGGYLAFMLSVVLALGLYFYDCKKQLYSFLFVVLTLIGMVALYYTFSRSGYLAFAFSVLGLTFFKSRKLLIVFILVGLLGIGFSPRVQERVGNAVDSAKALIGVDSQRALDPTARLRVDSWNNAFEIIHDHPWIGVGYSRYSHEIIARGHGLASDHNVGGSDSSLLTLWATTGIFGLLTYLLIGFVAMMVAVRRISQKKDFKSYLNVGLLAAFFGIMIHSVFVNSLLYPLLMVYLWTGLGMMDEG